MKRVGLGALAITWSLFAASSARCADSLVEVPTDWRLENYLGNSVVSWLPRIICDNGMRQLHFDSSATNDDKNRYWSTVLSAKFAGKKIFVIYDKPTCNIISFGAIEGQ
jgi:hypothetical protein